MATSNGKRVTVNAVASDWNGAVAAAERDLLNPLAAAQYRTMFEQSPDATLVTSAAGQYLDANPAALALLGYAREELLGLRVEDVVSPGPGWTAETHTRSVRNGRWQSDVEVRIKSGATVPMDARTVVLAGPGGGTHVSVLRDLTERSRNDMTRARMAALVKSSADAIVSETLDGIITDWNQAAERLYGYTAEEAIGQPLEILAPPERAHEVYALLARARRGESIAEIETVRWTKDGRLIDVSLTIWPVRNDAGQIFAASAIVRDITARKAAEAALAASETRFRATFEDAPIGMALVRPDGQILQVNQATRAFLGYQDDELLAMTMQDITHPDDWETDLAHAERAVSGEIRAYELQKRYVHKDGQTVRARLNVSLIRDEVGAPHYFVAQIQDVTERKAAEAERTTTQQQARQVLERISDGFYALDQDWRFTYINEAAEQMLDRTRDELLHHSIWEAFPATVETPLYDAYHKAVAEKITTTVEFYSSPLDAWFAVGAYPSSDGVSVFFRDVSASRQIAEELRASEAKYRTLVEQLPAVVNLLAADEHQTPLYFSPHLQQLTGFLPEDALARIDLWLERVHPEDRDRVAAEDARTTATGEPFQMEYRHVRKDGSYIWVRDGREAIRDEAGQVTAWQGVLIDVTERKQFEQELEAALEAAQAGIRAKSHFLAMMSHELRTPLQAVLGYADFLLADQQTSLTPEQTEDIGYIHTGASRMVTLIEQLLDLSRMEAGRLELAAEPVDLAEVIEQVRQDIAPLAAAKSLDVQVDVPPALPQVLGDPVRLRQIVLNLAANAVKFTEEGSVRITAIASDDGVDVAISDTGIGIAAEALEHIFEEFRQVDSTTSRPNGGAGLGLAIAKGLAEHMGGTIQVESRPEDGSTFTLSLVAS